MITNTSRHLRLNILSHYQMERSASMSIKYIIAQIRHEKNMTQKQLARKAGISTAMISFIENDKRQPTFYVIALIAKALDVTVDELVVIKDSHRFFK